LKTKKHSLYKLQKKSKETLKKIWQIKNGFLPLHPASKGLQGNRKAEDKVLIIKGV
jgi:hypothetical protein